MRSARLPDRVKIKSDPLFHAYHHIPSLSLSVAFKYAKFPSFEVSEVIESQPKAALARRQDNPVLEVFMI